MKKLAECPEDIVTEEVKSAVIEAIDSGCILKTSENNQSTSRVRRSADLVCLTLDAVALQLSKLEDRKVSKEIENDDPVYRFCNSGTYYTAHIFTFGFYSGWTLGANIAKAIEGKPIDWSGISNVLSGISFFVGIFSAKGWLEGIKTITDATAELTCQGIEDVHKIKGLSEKCSSIIWIKNVIKYKKR